MHMQLSNSSNLEVQIWKCKFGSASIWKCEFGNVNLEVRKNAEFGMALLGHPKELLSMFHQLFNTAPIRSVYNSANQHPVFQEIEIDIVRSVLGMTEIGKMNSAVKPVFQFPIFPSRVG